jgi:hypothetical protein
MNAFWLVNYGKTTWDRLEKAGKCLTPVRRGPKSNNKFYEFVKELFPPDET